MNARKKLEYVLPSAWPPAQVLNPPPYSPWKRKLALDFHEVIVKWLDPFLEFANQTYGLQMTRRTIDRYEVPFSSNCELSWDQFIKLFSQFVRLGNRGYGGLEAYEGVVEDLRKIKDAGIELEIMTYTPGPGDLQPQSNRSHGSGVAKRLTRELIVQLDLPLDAVRDLRFVKPGTKGLIMAREGIPFIAEDNPTEAVSVAMNYGLGVFLFSAPYNKGLKCPNVLRVRDRRHFASAVIDSFDKLADRRVLL